MEQVDMEQVEKFLEIYPILGEKYITHLKETSPEWDKRSIPITHQVLIEFYNYIKENVI